MFLGKSITLHPIYDPPPVRCHLDFLSDSKLPPPPYKEVPPMLWQTLSYAHDSWSVLGIKQGF